MANITLSDLLSLVFTDLATTVERTAEESPLRLQVTDVNLDIPAYLRLQEAGPDPETEPARFILTMPSTRDTPAVGGLGRVTVTIAVQTLQSQEQQEQPAPPEGV
jgi:hypothetical protein